MEKGKVVLRIIDTDLSRGSYSASLDEAIARAVSRGMEPTLHFYRRSPPAVTLGYFCKIEDDVNVEYCKREGISIVRRWTGGGTIYTDENALVYGLSCPMEYLPENILGTYEIICGAIV
ncbi:MAG: lipoate--protein ligase family protein, partial [Thermoplasmata archaeon]